MDAKQLLKTAHLKVTPARLLVLKILANARKPLTVGEINRELSGMDLKPDTVTIYRTLESFLDSRIILQLEFGEGKFRYELTRDEHHHFICENCNTVLDIDSCPVADLEKSIRREKQVVITRHSLEFFGLCNQCQSL
jgi:Fe2+ or Zn2+ uptake regulation protein